MGVQIVNSHNIQELLLPFLTLTCVVECASFCFPCFLVNKEMIAVISGGTAGYTFYSFKTDVKGYSVNVQLSRVYFCF